MQAALSAQSQLVWQQAGKSGARVERSVLVLAPLLEEHADLLHPRGAALGVRGHEAVGLARDEAGFLDRCLASVAAIVDQIVLVDTGSVDDTVAVARRYDALVLEHSWNNDFSVARNVVVRARPRFVFVVIKRGLRARE